MSCTPPQILVGGVLISTSDFVNAAELFQISDDSGDPVYDEFEGNIANGNNNNNRTGIQFPPSTQTTLPPPIPEPATASNDKKPTLKTGAPTGCPIWDGVDYNIYLSPNFKLSNFTTAALFKNPLTDLSGIYPGLTQQVRFCNLMNLAINVAEPLRAALGNMQINSGIRNTNSTAAGRVSQHVTGQAMDVQFTGWSYERYWENAQWVKDNIPYDQFIFEHSSKTGLAWYHLSYNASGNRAATAYTKVMTMYRNNYDSGLKKYG